MSASAVEMRRDLPRCGMRNERAIANILEIRKLTGNSVQYLHSKVPATVPLLRSARRKTGNLPPDAQLHGSQPTVTHIGITRHIASAKVSIFWKMEKRISRKAAKAAEEIAHAAVSLRPLRLRERPSVSPEFSWVNVQRLFCGRVLI